MNQNEANRSFYETLRDEDILLAIEDPDKRIALIQFLESRGLLVNPSRQRV